MIGKELSHKELISEINRLKEVNAELTKVNERLLTDFLKGNVSLLSENKLEFVQDLIENLPTVCFSFDKKGKILSWNKSANKTYGYTKDEALGVNALDLIVSPEDKKITKDIIDGVFHGKSYDAKEWHDHNRKGEPVPHTGNIFPVYRNDGTVAFGMNININIPLKPKITPASREKIKKETELLNYWHGLIEQVELRTERLVQKNKKLLQEKLVSEQKYKEREKQYKLIAENVNDVIWIFDITERRMVYMSPSVYNLRGFSPEEAMKQTLEESLSPQSYEKIKKVMEENIPKVLAGDKEIGAATYELQQYCKDGSLKWVEVSTTYIEDPENKNVCLLGITRNIDEKKKAEDALKESEAKYRQLIEGLKDEYVFYSHSPDGIFDYMSPTSKNVFGHNPEDMIGKHYEDVLKMTADTKNVAQEIDKKNLTGKMSEPHDFSFFHPDGSIRTVKISERPVLDDDGNVISVEGIAQDVTERRKNVRALKKSEAKYRQLIEGFTEEYVFFSHSLSGVFDYLSPTAIKVLGVEAESAIGKNFREVLNMTEETRKKVKVAEKELSANRKHTFEFSFFDSLNNIRTLRINERPVLDDTGNVTSIEGIAQDITELKKSEKALRESEEKFRAVTETSPVAISILQLDKILYVNSAWTELTGYTTEESMNIAPLSFVHPDMRDIVKARAIARLKGEKVPNRYELKGLRKNGDIVWWDFTAIPIDYENQKAILAVASDITKNKENEQEIRDSEEKFRALAELSPVAITFNRYDHYLYVNAAYEKITGWTKDDCKTLDPMMTIHPDMRDIIRRRLQDRLKGKEVPNRYELKGIKKDGSTIWFDISATAIMYKGERTVVAALQDITETKKAAETLRKSEELFRTLFENLGDAIMITKDRIFQDVNRAVTKIFGYDKLDLVGKSTKLIHISEENYIEYGALVYPEIHLNKISRIEWTFKNKASEHIIMDVTLTELMSGSIISILKDVTARKHTEKALKETEARFRAVFESSPMGIHLYELKTNNDLVLIDSNPAADKHTGIKNQELLGKTIEEAFPPLADTEIPSRYREAAAQGKYWHTVQLSYDNEKISGAFDVYAFQISANKMAALFLDVTERKLAEEQLKESAINYRKLSEQLSEANNLKDLLLDVITHDLRNPATVIYNSAELIEDDIPDPELFEIIKASSAKLFKVMENAKILAQVTSDETIQTERFDICDSIRESIDEHMALLKANSIEVIFEPNRAYPVLANEIISQVFKNYISNVIKYAADSNKIVIDIFEENKNTIVKVKDTGITIKPDEREEVFKRGVQLSKLQRSGRGLGLSIVKRIAEAHHGKVWVEPNIPNGNCFCLQIPSAK